MSLIDNKKIKDAINERLVKEINNFSLTNAVISIIGIVFIIWGFYNNELSWIPTGFLLIDKARGKNENAKSQSSSE